MLPFTGAVFGLVLLGCFIWWAARDARRRNKNPLLVTIAVVFFFPFGLLAWLLFRPSLDQRFGLPLRKRMI